MKKSIGIILTVLAALSLSSCVENTLENTLNMDGVAENILFDVDPVYPYSFSLTTDSMWSISKSEDMSWLKISQISGLPGSYEIQLTASKNEWIARSGQIVVRAGSKTHTLNVKQDFSPVIYPLVSIPGDEYTFECYDTDKKSFVVMSTVPWTLSCDASWVGCSVKSGDIGQTTVAFSLEENTVKSVRSAKLTFTGEGASYVLNLNQKKYQNSIKVFGLPESGSYDFDPVEKDTLAVKILSGEDWVISTPDWVKTSASSGSPITDTLTVLLTTEPNGPSRHVGTVEFASVDGERVLLTVNQAPGVLARWTLSNAALTATKWASSKVASADAAYPGATMSMVQKNTFGKTPSCVVSSDGYGHYAIKTTAPGDYVEFKLPVSELAAGTKIAVRFGLSGLANTLRYYRLEYYEDNDWHATSLGYFDGRATVDLASVGAKNCMNLNETFTLAQNLTSGELRIRLLFVGDTLQDTISGGTMTSSSPLRIRQWEHAKGVTAGDGTNPYILISVVD